jgi:hypothetical protein
MVVPSRFLRLELLSVRSRDQLDHGIYRLTFCEMSDA